MKNLVHLAPIQHQLDTLEVELKERPASDALAKPALNCLTKARLVARVLESATVEATRRAQSLSKTLAPTLQRTASEVADLQRPPTAQDRQAAESSYVKRHQQRAVKDMLATIAESFTPPGQKATAGLVDAMKGYATAIERAEFERDSPSLFGGMTPAQHAEFDHRMIEVNRMAPAAVGDQLQRAANLYGAGHSTCLLWQRLATAYLDHFEATPKTERARHSPRPSCTTADAVGIRVIKGLLSELTAAEQNDRAELHRHVVLPKRQLIFRLMCWIHAPQLSQREFAHYYLTAGNAPEPYRLHEDWLTRYTNPSNVEALNKAFSVDVTPATLGTTRSASKGKSKTTTREDRAGAMAARKAETQARRDAARREPPSSGQGGVSPMATGRGPAKEAGGLN